MYLLYKVLWMQYLCTINTERKWNHRTIWLPLLSLCTENPGCSASDGEQSLCIIPVILQNTSEVVLWSISLYNLRFLWRLLQKSIYQNVVSVKNKEHWPLRTSEHPVWGSPRGSSCSSWGTSLPPGSRRCLMGRCGRSWGTFSCLQELGSLLQRTAGTIKERTIQWVLSLTVGLK